MGSGDGLIIGARGLPYGECPQALSLSLFTSPLSFLDCLFSNLLLLVTDHPFISGTDGALANR